MNNNTYLEVKDLSKSFGSFEAIKNIDININIKIVLNEVIVFFIIYINFPPI